MGDGLAETIRELRRQSGDTQESLARKLVEVESERGDAKTATGSLIGQWENGTARPTIERVSALEVVFGCRPGDLTRLLGYIPIEGRSTATPESAIRADSDLTDSQRRTLLAILAEFRSANQ